MGLVCYTLHASQGSTRGEASQERMTFQEKMAPSVARRQGLYHRLGKAAKPCLIACPDERA
eukprot:2267074-Pyramimonas_sp.AAC.1